MELYPSIDIPLYLLCILLTCLLVYIYASWPYNQLKQLGLSGPPPELFFGNQRQLFSQGTTINALKKWHKEYGRVYGIYIYRRPFIVVNDLDTIKTVLIKDFANFSDRPVEHAKARAVIGRKGLVTAKGEDWKRIRSIVTPTFSSGKMRLMEPQFNRCCRDLTDSLQQKAQTGELVNVKECFGAYTLDVIASTAFGIQVNSQKDVNDPFLVNVQELFGASTARKLHRFNVLLGYLPFLAPLVGWLRNNSRLLNFYRASVQSIMQQRKAAGTNKAVDFLQLMINAEDTDSATGSSRRLTTEEVEAQLMLFFFAGYETTATTLQYLAYNLAKHPDVQQRILKEIETELGEEEPTYENVLKLNYLDQTIHETLRLFPPATMLRRLASKTVTINGVTIPKGFGVLIPAAVVMRDPEYHPEPEKFDPDRFSNKADMDNVTFLAFGRGPRTCVGMRLALLEIKMAMVHVLRRVTFVRTPDLPETVTFKHGVVNLLNSATTLMVKVVPRCNDQ